MSQQPVVEKTHPLVGHEKRLADWSTNWSVDVDEEWSQCKLLQVELPLVVQELHQQRHGLLQTQAQYTFCYEALLAAVQSLTTDHWIHTLTTCTFIHFASAAVAVLDSSHMTPSLSSSCCRFSLPSNYVDGHVSTMWFMVCRWPQSQEGDWARHHLCKFARHGPWPVHRWHVLRQRDPGTFKIGNTKIYQIKPSFFPKAYLP